MPSLIYLHGFLSSPDSTKAKQTQRWMANNFPRWAFLCPALSSYPNIAKEQLSALCQSLEEEPLIIGSSLGGYWATWCVERFGGRAVLVNPAVSPQNRFHHYLNKPLKSFYSDDEYLLNQSHLNVLAECDCVMHKNHAAYLVMLQTGDETLDFRLAQTRYKNSTIYIEEGGNHSFEGYETHLPYIFEFLTAAR